ncbi:hypothetical protein Bbelb_367500 [Branchiostoma belcheri]|nr:hypothetical protein Bbelb_367500 [Branchiostoma belcheri]
MPTDSVSRSAQDYSFNFHQTMKNGCSAAARLRQNVTDNVGVRRKLPGSECDLVPARDCQVHYTALGDGLEGRGINNVPAVPASLTSISAISAISCRPFGRDG